MPDTEPIKQLIERLTASLGDGTFVRLILSGSCSDRALEKVIARRVDLKGSPHLSLTFRYGTRDESKTLALGEGVQWIRERAGREFRGAMLCTTTRDWQLVTPRAGKMRLIAHKPAATAAPSREHDQPRHTLLGPTAEDWLQGLGVTDATGKVRVAMTDKHRQINHYVEILSHLAKDCGWHAQALEAPGSP